MSEDDNVVTLTPPVTFCSSCKQPVPHGQRFEVQLHGPECQQPEIRMRRAEAMIGQLLEAVSALSTGFVKLQQENAEQRASLMALARYTLTPGECLAPDIENSMACGGSDLCPCRSDSGFHGTCGISEALVSLINEHVKAHPEPWRYMAPDATAHLPEEHWKEHFRRIALRLDRNYDELTKRVEALTWSGSGMDGR